MSLLLSLKLGHTNMRTERGQQIQHDLRGTDPTKNETLTHQAQLINTSTQAHHHALRHHLNHPQDTLIHHACTGYISGGVRVGPFDTSTSSTTGTIIPQLKETCCSMKSRVSLGRNIQIEYAPKFHFHCGNSGPLWGAN